MVCLVAWIGPLLINAQDVAREVVTTVAAGQWARTGVERGERLIGELRCTACHAAPEGLAARLDTTDLPDLPRRLARRPPGFVATYLEAPQRLHPGGAMPDLLARLPEPEKAQVIRELTAFLDALVPPAIEAPRPAHPLRFQQGRVLYHRVGCIACHPPFEPADEVFDLQRGAADEEEEEAATGAAGSAQSREVVNLVELRWQWTRSSLAEFLLDPRGNEPRRRMPPMNLTDEEAAAVAEYLLGRDESDGTAGELAGEPDAGSGGGLIEAGRLRFQELGCAACHRVEVDGRVVVPRQAAAPLTALVDDAGRTSCLTLALPGTDAAEGAVAGRSGGPAPPRVGLAVPRYALSQDQVAALSAALRAVNQGLPVLSATDRVQRTLARFNCLGCHERGGQGGPGGEQADYFRTLVTADLGWEGRLPPHLNGVGAKLRPEWLQQVLEEGTRVRPYLATHMPTLDPVVAMRLAEDMRAADRREGWPKEVPALDAPAAAGRALLGATGLACVTCHQFEGQPGLTMSVLDLAWTRSRLEWPWFRRYLVDPVAVRPGTRMPSFWPEGRSALPDILGGDTDRQMAAIWAALQEAHAPPPP